MEVPTAETSPPRTLIVAIGTVASSWTLFPSGKSVIRGMKLGLCNVLDISTSTPLSEHHPTSSTMEHIFPHWAVGQLGCSHLLSAHMPQSLLITL